MSPRIPLLLFDGDCGFCRFWIDRWKSVTQNRVAYRPYQEVIHEFPQLSEDACRRAVQFIEPDGRISSAAEAVFRARAMHPKKRGLLWAYAHLPGFAALSEIMYRMIARHRSFFSWLTRLLVRDARAACSYDSADQQADHTADAPSRDQ